MPCNASGDDNAHAAGEDKKERLFRTFFNFLAREMNGHIVFLSYAFADYAFSSADAATCRRKRGYHYIPTRALSKIQKPETSRKNAPGGIADLSGFADT